MILEYLAPASLAKLTTLSDVKLNSQLIMVRNLDSRYFVRETTKSSWFGLMQTTTYNVLFFQGGSQAQLVNFYIPETGNIMNVDISGETLFALLQGIINGFHVAKETLFTIDSNEEDHQE